MEMRADCCKLFTLCDDEGDDDDDALRSSGTSSLSGEFFCKPEPRLQIEKRHYIECNWRMLIKFSLFPLLFWASWVAEVALQYLASSLTPHINEPAHYADCAVKKGCTRYVLSLDYKHPPKWIFLAGSSHSLSSPADRQLAECNMGPLQQGRRPHSQGTCHPGCIE